MAKQMKIVLAPIVDATGGHGEQYQVVRTVNTMRCVVGEILPKYEVELLVKHPTLNVAIQTNGRA